jgi:hypothetical protein
MVIRVVRDRRLTSPKGDRAFVERWLRARGWGREGLAVADGARDDSRREGRHGL